MMNQERMINGKLHLRRFAYLHKVDSQRCGVLEAVDQRDARAWLGSRYHIRQVWLAAGEEREQRYTRAAKLRIVAAVFRDIFPANVKAISALSEGDF